MEKIVSQIAFTKIIFIYIFYNIRFDNMIMERRPNTKYIIRTFEINDNVDNIGCVLGYYWIYRNLNSQFQWWIGIVKQSFVYYWMSTKTAGNLISFLKIPVFIFKFKDDKHLLSLCFCVCAHRAIHAIFLNWKINYEPLISCYADALG